VLTKESDSSAVLLPLTAIYAPIGGDDYVWIVDENNRLQMRRVQLGGLSGDSSVVVLSGVESGDRVVSAGVYHLNNGERVRLL
jgi:multidrug efflux pump subunit AcrA (membrane-fusion protein)